MVCSMPEAQKQFQGIKQCRKNFLEFPATDNFSSTTTRTIHGIATQERFPGGIVPGDSGRVAPAAGPGTKRNPALLFFVEKTC